MILDSSALVAIAMQEPEAAVFAQTIRIADQVYISAATIVEASIVLMRKSREGSIDLVAQLVESFSADVVPVSADQANLAVEAYRRFGKGRHPAALNFGDCFSYALAKQRGEPLLFKGNDFSQTDVLIAAY